MSDIESDYVDYENTKDDEGGLHTGRNEASRNFVLALACVVAMLVIGSLVIAIIR